MVRAKLCSPVPEAGAGFIVARVLIKHLLSNGGTDNHGSARTGRPAASFRWLGIGSCCYGIVILIGMSLNCSLDAQCPPLRKVESVQADSELLPCRAIAPEPLKLMEKPRILMM